ncbi:MAG: ribonuclease III [Armatimonadetes bacterium RBG_16_58_9]|nr:MAG: ribonuclease III [Armatimonadetes bacterium RBG_16_58_9]
MVLDRTTLRQFARELRIDVTDYSLLRQALTHRSYLGESAQAMSNERLEFLGDSVLGIVVAEYLYTQFSDRAEGELAKAKAVAVSEPVLGESARSLGLSDMILMSAGEEASGGRSRLSILADTFEALIAVIYLDCGMDAARQFILRALESILIDIEREEHIRDYKSLLQEHTQGIHKKAPSYEVMDELGADHDKTFTVQVKLDDRVLGSGEGKSKKQAEQAAALQALESIERQSVCEPKESR